MVTRLLYRLRVLLSKETTAKFGPKVRRTTADSFFSYVLAFEDSTTLLAIQRRRLFISFDNGVNWEKSDAVPASIIKLEIDENYRSSRAVATTPHELYLTEDQGKHWRKLNLPEPEQYGLDTHPFEKDYLLARCVTCCPVDEACKENSDDDDSICEPNSYVSDDGGRNFRKIESPDALTEYWEYWLGCGFACKSKDSIFSSNKDLVRCFDWGRNRGHVFYTDFGKSIKFFDQFKDHTVLSLRILDSHVLVSTVGNKLDECSTTDLWVSNDGFTFNKAFLPTVLRNPTAQRVIEDGLGRIIISTNSFEKGEESPIFISDSSGLQFHLLDIGIKDTLVSSSLKASKTLKGTMWVTLESAAKYGNEKKINSYSKISSDYGETWSNIRVMRSPGQRKDLFPCDVEDLKNCSLKLSSYLGVESSPNAGILMSVGTVGRDASHRYKSMTFISRDGGRSWEVALEYPCIWVFGDGGNIIVAIPSRSSGGNVPKGEFYYSLDEGKTWKKYQLEAPVYLSRIISTTSDGSGLHFTISGSLQNADYPRMTKGLLYIVDFTDAFNDQSYGSKDLET